METRLKISIRTTHLSATAVANFAVAAMLGVYMHAAWALHDKFTLGIAIFLFAGTCALSFYSWIFIVWRAL